MARREGNEGVVEMSDDEGVGYLFMATGSDEKGWGAAMSMKVICRRH